MKTSRSSSLQLSTHSDDHHEVSGQHALGTYRPFPDPGKTGGADAVGAEATGAAAPVSVKKGAAVRLLKCWLPVAITAVVFIVVAAVLLALYLPPLSPPAPPAPAPAPARRKFLHLSDFHLDRIYNASYSTACFCNDPFVANQSDPATEAAQAAKCFLPTPDWLLGRHGCDSPEELVNSTLQLAHAVMPNPEFILVTGDYVRHRTDGILGGGQARLDLILGTMDRVVELVQHFFPEASTHHAIEPFYEGSGSEGGIAMLNMLGNNDLDGNYVLPVPAAGTESPWLASVAPFFFSRLQANQSATFRRGGFYQQEVVPGVHILSLNTVVYSPSHRPSNVTLADPFGQFAWLEATLGALAARARRQAAQAQAQASSMISSKLVRSGGVADASAPRRRRRRLGAGAGAGVGVGASAGAGGGGGEADDDAGAVTSVFIVGHIPPTYDQVSFTQQWEQRFSERYFAIVDRYRDVVRGQLFGHVHCNTFRLANLPSGATVPIFLTSAFTPVYQNNPGFRVWSFEDTATAATGGLTSFSMYAQSVNASSPLPAPQALVEWSTSMQELNATTGQLLTNDTAWNAYVDQMWSFSDASKVAQYRAEWTFRSQSYCAIRFWKNTTYDACVDCYAAGYDPSCP